MDFKMISPSELTITENFPLRKKHPNALCRLAESIRTYGLQSPLLVRPQNDGGYVILDGKLRLLVWNHLGKTGKIPCVIVDSDVEKIADLDFFRDVEAFKKNEAAAHIRNLYRTLAVNMVRSKVDHSCLKAIVKYLHDVLNLGYGTIAQRIGYSKAGVQRMLKRMEAEKDCPVEDSSVPAHSLRRLKTELKRLRETIPPAMEDADDVKEAIQRIRGYIDSLIGDSAD